jgi:4-oxalomesaconate tautomerase
LAAITVATATRLHGTPTNELVTAPSDGRYRVEHPTGEMEVLLDIGEDDSVRAAGTVRTARKLFEGGCSAGEPI